MVHPSSVRWRLVPLLLVAILTLWCLLILFLRAIIRHMTLFATTETFVRSVEHTGLHRGCIGVPLMWCLLTTLLLVLLTLLELVALWVWSMVPPIRWSLVPLLETLLWVWMLARATSRGLSLKPPLLGFYLCNTSGVTSLLST